MSARMATAGATGRTMDLRRLLRPRSVAIVGASANPTSMGARALAALDRFGFAGEVHLVNPKRPVIGDRQCVGSVDELPMGVDAAIFAIPQAGIEDAVRAAIGRNLGGAVVFSAGFAEMGEEGRAAQARLTALARDGGLALAGPNCLGLVSYDDRVPLTSGPVLPADRRGRPGLAVLTQSGGMMGCMINASEARGLPLSYAISTGNEAVLSIVDYFDVVVDEDNTRAIAVFAEQIREPARFLRLAERAREIGKTVILLHSGKSARAQAASLSHTGAVASNYAAMRAAVEAAGVIVVDGMDSLIDVAELVTRFDRLPWRGAAISTDSGAFKALALDFAEDAGLPLPELAPRTLDRLRAVLPDFVEPSNPLDLTGQAMNDIDTMYLRTAEVLAEDDEIDLLMVCQLPGAPHVVKAKAEAVARLKGEVDVPVMSVFLGNGQPIPDEARAALADANVPLFQSGEAAIRAAAVVIRHERRARPAVEPSAAPPPIVPPLARSSGALAEHESKAWFAEAIGLPVPQGKLARSRAEAVAIAEELGFPVVLKIQHADLAHKSDVGGVVVGVADAEAAGRAWDTIVANLEAARPGQVFDGILVEAMGAKGVELVLGATRDPDWGPMLLVGLGGVWIEILKDVRLVPAAAGPEAIRAALLSLNGARLLTGYRGAPPVDLDAVASLADRLGRLMLAEERIAEVDLNPLIARPDGEGVLALDALMVLRSGAEG